MLLNAFKDIGLAVNIRKTKYMEVESHRGMNANEHITVCRNTYEKLKTCEYLIDKSKFYSRWNKM